MGNDITLYEIPTSGGANLVAPLMSSNGALGITVSAGFVLDRIFVVKDFRQTASTGGVPNTWASIVRIFALISSDNAVPYPKSCVLNLPTTPIDLRFTNTAPSGFNVVAPVVYQTQPTTPTPLKAVIRSGVNRVGISIVDATADVSILPFAQNINLGSGGVFSFFIEYPAD
jgi:hypothetical protein